MPRIDDLPADRRAVLQLLLKQGKSYDDLAGLLRIEPDTVRERARDALDRLGPADTELDMAEQDEIADYLLGQQTASARAATRDLLETSAAGRAWARVVSGELRPLGGDALPEIPSERAEVDEAFGALEARKVARERQAKSSRLGGVLLLAAVGVAVAFLIVFVLTGNDDDKSDNGAGVGTTTSQTTGTTANGQQQILGQVNMKAVKGSPSSKALAALTLVAQGQSVGMIFQGQDIPPNDKGDAYALWVVNSKNAARLGFTPRVGQKGRLRFSGQVPDDINLADFQAILVTRETTSNPRTPSNTIILAGSLGQSS
jgi:anti-sigma-K factor RskA